MNAEGRVGRAACVEKALFVFCFFLYDRLSSAPFGPKSQLFYDDIQYTRLPWTQEYVKLASQSLVHSFVCVRGLRSFSVPLILLGVSQ